MLVTEIKRFYRIRDKATAQYYSGGTTNFGKRGKLYTDAGHAKNALHNMAYNSKSVLKGLEIVVTECEVVTHTVVDAEEFLKPKS